MKAFKGIFNTKRATQPQRSTFNDLGHSHTEERLSRSSDALGVSGEVPVTDGSTGTECPDASLQQAVRIVVAPDKMSVVMQVLCPPRSFNELMGILECEGFQGELDIEGVRALSCATKPTERVVVRGRDPAHGSAPWYELLRFPARYDPLLKRAHVVVPAGTTVAVFHPEISSAPGLDVYGTLVAGTTRARLPVLGKGVLEKEGRVVSTCAGRIVFNDQVLDVLPELVIAHDVIPEDGEIVFDGDVRVYGSVQQGSTIRVTGSLIVEGSVVGSIVTAENGLTIANSVVKSHLSVGQMWIARQRLAQLLIGVIEQLDAFHKDYELLTNRSANAPLTRTRVSTLCSMLLKTRYHELTCALGKLLEDSSRPPLSQEATAHGLLTVVQEKWIEERWVKLDSSDIVELRGLASDYVERVQGSGRVRGAALRVTDVISSSLRVAGHVIVGGNGTYNSSIESLGSVVVRGFMRGGFVLGGRTIRIRETGVPLGTECSIQVQRPTGRIVIQTRHPNTVLDVDGYRTRNVTTEYEVQFRKPAGVAAVTR